MHWNYAFIFLLIPLRTWSPAFLFLFRDNSSSLSIGCLLDEFSRVWGLSFFLKGREGERW